MLVEKRPREVILTLDGNEVHLLRRGLERASFVDTPAAEQPEILRFCERLLGALPSAVESTANAANVPSPPSETDR